MNAKLYLNHHCPNQTIAAAALATAVALSIFWGVATLFQSRGELFAQAAAAERVCAMYAYQSERQECMIRWIAENNTTTVARR